MKEQVNKRGMNRQGQITIFIIVAVVIVALGLLVYMFYPKIQDLFGTGAETPSDYFQQCLEDEIEEAIEILAPQGGMIEPEFYYMYKGDRIRYLCYTEEDYATCVMQEPFLQGTIQEEISDYINEKASKCLDDLEKSFERKGYNVNLNKGGLEVELLPERVIARVNGSVSISKEGETKSYDAVSSVVTNNIYEFVAIANSILNWEARYGDAETTLYMTYYRDLKVEKLKQTDGTTIYILTNRDTGNKFQFASRSIAWPSGY